MTIERARMEVHEKPWGVVDAQPWTKQSGRIGELWFERAARNAPRPALQLKLLLTNQPLSIQVHPDDEQAQAAGFAHGKTEAWYVLKAEANATVGLGLRQKCSLREVRSAVQDGTIGSLVYWKNVRTGDVVNVPAGTIHAIGAGLVIAEIQQRSDITFRLFDHGRNRELHVESALAVAILGPSTSRARSGEISEQRQLLSGTAHFSFERIVLAPGSKWSLETECETWLLLAEGTAEIGANALVTGDGLFADADQAEVEAGAQGAMILVAYAKSSVLPYLLQRRQQSRPISRAERGLSSLTPKPGGYRVSASAIRQVVQ
jgi:mannose-6-phosphate isomerase